jgi:hypothetical protein
MFFPGGLLQPGFPFEQTMSCHILYLVKMAYRYLLMFYVHALLVSIQLRSQYHKKNQAPWCWNQIFGWLSSIWSVKFHCFFSVHPQFKKNDMIFYLIGKLRCFFPVGSPFSILYGFFPQDFLLHRNVCGCQGSGLNRTSVSICYIWLKSDIYIYICTTFWLSWYTCIHTCIYIPPPHTWATRSAIPNPTLKITWLH